MEIISSIVVKIAECTVAPIGQWLCYSFHYKSNIENLKNEEKNLREVKNRVQHSVEVALISNYDEEIEDEVNTWLKKVGDIIELATKKLRESEEVGSRSCNVACLNLKHRHQLSWEAKKIVENIAELVKNENFDRVSYLPASKGMDYNIENLKNQEENLQGFKNRLQHSVEAALRNGDEIEDDVKKWFTKANRITELATINLRENEKEAGTRSSNVACLDLKHRHRLSREAKKLAENIAELVKNGNFDRVSYCPASKGMETTRNMDYMAMKSRLTAVKEIMEALGNADINKIGVWGMPGVGKSTLMKEIARQARQENLFNEVVMTLVTNSPDVRHIQGEIADTLGLKFDQETEKGRASHLQQRLSKDKNVLVILDDIWKAFDLHDIGIPSEGCKVVMTSRDRDVLICGMRTQKAIELNILRKEEAWNLFEKNVGESVSNPNLRGIATEIVEKCAGLPIALVTVSRALKDKRLAKWKDALVQLTRATHGTIIDGKIWSPVYSCIELSYEHLVGKEVKSLFLLCARQGYYISYRDLLRYGFGLGLFDGIDTLEEARNRLESLVSNLQDSCLLLESPHSFKKFYMHDLVRDVATIIASKNHNMFVMRDDGGQKAWPDVEALNRCEALSIHGGDIHKDLNKMEFPKLRFFHVECKDSHNLKILDISFQGMEKLKVLSLRNMQLLSFFPLTNLQTLCLAGCKLGDIHGIGELKTLVILSLAYSDISNLPREIGSLTRLQLLDLSNCFELRVIPPNVLSSLVNLEELYMRYINVQWGVEGPSNEGKNASLAELKNLSHLITLEIDIPDANNLPKGLFTEKFERYKICIGGICYLSFKVKAAFSRSLKLKLNLSFQLDVGIKMLLKRTEYLYLDEENSTKSVLYEVDREDFQQLKHLHIENSDNIKHIPELGTSAVAFPILETFVLENMISLEEICQGNLPLESFKNLKVLKVDNCKKLRYIFSSSIARGLSLLEELEITRCNNMGAIFVKEEEDGIEDQGDMMLFGRLQTLVLKYLPNLVGFLGTKDSFMADCRETNSEGNHDLQLPLLHHDQVSFPSLQTLRMEGLLKIKHVWSCGQEPKTVFTGLKQLKILEISNCGVEEIVAVEGGGEAVAIRTLVFPRVSTLKFRNLWRLKWVFKGVHVSKWPMLKEMTIEGCEKVEIFASEVVSFGKTVEDQKQSEMSNIKQPLFSVDEHSIPSLETLFISNMDSVEIIFGKLEGQNGKESQVLISPASGTEESGATTHFVSTGKLPLIYFKNLKVLEVENYQKLRFLFSSSIARGLSLLEKLIIKRCNNMGAIVVTEEKDGIEDGDVILFHQLQTLVLEDLPELVSFLSTKSSFMTDCGQIIAEGNHNLHMPLLPHQVSFPSLQTLRIKGLPKIKYVWSCGQEPKTVIRCLEQLQVLEIEDCGVEEIVAVERGGEAVAIRTSMFPQVTKLKFSNLPRLKRFYKGVHVSKWPMLKEMKIARCEKVEIFASEVVSFEKAVKDQRQFEMSIKQPLFSVNEGKLPLIYFKNLKVLEVENYQKLRFLFSSSIARGLSLLEKLIIKRCNNMGAIVVTEEKDGIEDGDVILFHQLQTLVLEDLPELVSFLSTKSSFMTDCGQIIAEGNHNLHMPLLPHQVSFPSLQTLRMKDLRKIKHVWSYDQEPQTMFRFQALQDIYVGKCESLTSLFPAWVLRCLEQLQVLKIKDCGVEEIVAVEGGDGEAVARMFEFSRVTNLKFKNLKRLKWFYKGVHVSKWPMLKKMEIEGCKKVEIFASEVVSFGKTVEDQKQPLFSVDELSFPSLKKLHIWKMDKLEMIWQDQVAATSFSNIQELIIFECAKLLHVFQSNLHTTTTLMQSLNSLHIVDCDSLETIFGNMEWQNGKDSQVLIAPSSGLEESIAREEGTIRHIEFPTLTKMSLVGLPKFKWIFEGVHTNLECPSLKQLQLGAFGQVINMIWASKFPRSSSSQENQLQTCIQQPIFVFDEGTFPNLEHLSLGFARTICPSTFSDFPAGPSFPIIRLPTLLELRVYGSGWEEIFSYELVDREIRLSQLRLYHLPMLIHLWKEDSTQPCPLFHNLEFLRLSQCSKLKNIVPSSVSLHNLTRLKISQCHGLINLLTSSTAKTLVQLERMTVIDCKRITEIVAMEDGEANEVITFNKLTNLTLDGLPNLTHFCSGPYSFGFPSLDEVIVRCCPEMKTFSHGVLSTPKLKGVYDDSSFSSKRNLHRKDDLNTITCCLWEESNQYDTRLLFRERVENSEEDEDHP